MKTFYLDMDGVVADWDSYVEQLVGQARPDPTNPNRTDWGYLHWPQIRQQQRIYRDLPQVPNSNQLVDLARKFRDQLDYVLLFLTAVPRQNDIHWAFHDKMTWAGEHFPDIPVHFGPYSQDKYTHCEQGDILVDDRESNIREWQAQGGRGILIPSGDPNSALDVLNQWLSEELAQQARSASG